jgi:hypothetical protein
LSYNFFTAI